MYSKKKGIFKEKNYLIDYFYHGILTPIVILISLLTTFNVQAFPIWISSFGSYGTGNANFNWTTGVAFMSNGNIVVSDWGNQRVQVFDKVGSYLSQFGNGQLGNPANVAAANGGNILVADPNFNRIQVFNGTGTFSNSLTNGLAYPWGVAVYGSANNEVRLVTDTGNSRIQIFNGNNPGSTFNGSPNAQLSFPYAVATNSTGIRVVGDTGNVRIKVFDVNNNLQANFDGSASSGGKFSDMFGVAVAEDGTIVVADTYNSRIQIFDSSGTPLSKFGSWGGGNNNLRYPYAVDIVKNGTIIVADGGNHRVQILFDPTLWTSSDSNTLLQLPLNQSLTLGSGYNLDVQGTTTLTTNGNLTLSAASTFKTINLTMDGGTLIDENNTIINALITLTSNNGTFDSRSNNNLQLIESITGTGDLTFTNNGILTLSGSNNFGALNMNGGNVVLKNNAQTITDLIGNGSLNLTNIALTLGSDGDSIFSGNITGSSISILNKQNSGTLTLSGTDKFGTLNVNGGGINFSANSHTILGLSGDVTSNLTLGNNVNLTLNNNNVASYSGTLTGAASSTLTKQGIGTLTLIGANNFGALTINGGTVVFATNSQTITDLSGSGNLNLTGINLTLGSSNSPTFTGAISGTGSITKQGSGGLTLGGANNFGPLIIASGSITLNTNNQTITDLSGSGNLTLTNITLTLGSINTTSFSGNISGSNGNLIKQQSGSLNLSGNNSFGNLTINAGAINLSSHNQTIVDLSGAGNLGLTGINLTLGSTNNTTFSGIISGTGGITKQGTGTLTLTGANNFGTLAINAGGINLLTNNQTITDLSGTGTLGLLGVKLTLGSNNNSTFSGSIFNNTLLGGGSLEKQGVGTLTLAGTVITSGITIDAGTIKVPSSGALSGPVTINDNSILEMNGGTLSSPIVGSGNSTLNITGNFTPVASITNVKNIHVITPATFTVNQPVSGAGTISIDTQSTLNLNPGGSLSGNMTGLGTFNVSTNYVTPGTVSIDIFNVKSGGVVQITTPVTVDTGFNVEANGILYMDDDIKGNLDNKGTINNTGLVSRNITQDFTQSGTINVDFVDIFNFSNFVVGNDTTLNGGALAIHLPDNPLKVIDFDTFDVITSGNPITVVNSPAGLPNLTFPDSPVLTFAQTLEENGTVLRIKAFRKPLEIINTIPEFNDMCLTLNLLRRRPFSPEFLDVINALDAQSTAEGLESVLQQLAPAGINQSLVETSLRNLPFNFIEHRLGMLRSGVDSIRFARNAFYSKSGYAAGDLLEGSGSYGPMVFGNTKTQRERKNFSGYTAFTAGFGFLGDAPVSDYFRLGGALSYAGSSIKQDDETGNKTTIGNVQATVYGSASYGPLFLDGLLSLGFNNYRGKRNILVSSQTATANYNAVQYSSKLRGGFSIPINGMEISPLASVQYTHLNQGSYSEKGAPTANLSVNALKINAVQIGLGGSIADISRSEDILPELHILYLYYTKPPQLQMTAEFAEGSPAFVTNGIVPSRAGINVGTSLTLMLSDELFVVSSYDLESKKDSTTHAFSFKFKWLF